MINTFNQWYLYFRAKLLKSFNSRKSSPNKTPQKQKEKNRNLLDPSKLRPPPGLLVAPDDEILYVSDRNDSRPTSLSVNITLVDNETPV